MVYQQIQRSQEARSPKIEVVPKEYVVILLTAEVDEYGAPWERVVTVTWDAGVEPNWYEWLKLYIQGEQEEYVIDRIVEIGKREYEL